MKTKSLFFLFLLIITIASCKSSKQVATPDKKVRRISAKNLLNKISKRELDYEWFSAKVKMKYDDEEMSQNFTANIRMKRDSIVWMSFTGFLGLEGGRALITRDSVKIIDRINKKYYEYPLSYAKQYVPLLVEIADLQNVISGSNLLANRMVETVEVDDFMYQGSILEHMVELDFWVDPKNYTYHKLRLKHRFENKLVLYKFGNYKNVDKKLLSYNREIEITNGDKNIFIEMDYSKVDLESTQKFPFEVPSRYETGN